MKPLTRSELSVLKKWEPDREMDAWAVEATKYADVGLRMTPHSTRSTGCIHASSFTNRCDQFLLLELLGAKPVQRLPAKPRKIMDVGTAIHTLMDFYHSTRSTEYGYVFDYEVPIGVTPAASALKICGSSDGMSRGWPLPNRRILWEFKTIGKKAMADLRKPSKDYVTQAHVYMGALGVPVTAMTFIVKDNSTWHTYLVHFEEAIWEERIEKRATRINKIARAVVDDAPRNVGQGCYYCAYYNDCNPPLPARPKRQYGVPVP